MSIPVSACLIVKAAKGDKEAIDRLKKALRYNTKQGHFSIYPCRHEERCVITDEEETFLLKQLEESQEDEPRT